MIRAALDNAIPFGGDNDYSDFLDGIVPSPIAVTARALINAHIHAINISNNTRHLKRSATDAGYELAALKKAKKQHLSEIDTWTQQFSSWEDVSVSPESLIAVFKRPNLGVTSRKMEADVKRATICDGKLCKHAMARSMMERTKDDVVNKEKHVNAHVVFLTATNACLSSSISKLLYYVKVSRIMNRKSMMLAVPDRPIFSGIGRVAFMYEEYDLSVTDLVPIDMPPPSRQSEWNPSAVKCFWDMAASFVRPAPNNDTTGRVFGLMNQIDDLHHARLVHADLTRSTVRYDSENASFMICGLDRTERASCDDDERYGDNVRQCARVIKSILEFLIRMFFDHMKNVSSVDEEQGTAEAWGASLAAWSILRGALHNKLKQSGGEPAWRTVRHLKRWILSELEALYGRNALEKYEYSRIREVYAHTARSYDRKK